MQNNEGAKIHMAAKRRGLRAQIDGKTVTFFDGEARVWRGGREDARDFLARRQTTAKARSEFEKLKRRTRFRKLRPDDGGIESEDHSCPNGRGLVLTRVMLPSGVGADAALIALWAAENICTWRASPAISREIGAARSAMAGAKPVEVWLSDHDRESLERYGAPTSVVLIAAVMARRQSRAR